jgi:hypothetical protein
MASSNQNKLLLERVIGATVDQHACMAWNPITGELAYPAGSVIVCYSPRENKQTRFVYGRANRSISCLAFSANGKYIAAGEVRCEVTLP